MAYFYVIEYMLRFSENEKHNFSFYLINNIDLLGKLLHNKIDLTDKS